MCCVTKNVICLKDGLIPQNGVELTLFGIGEGIPPHFQKMIWLMEMVNRADNITNCAAAVNGKTKLSTSTKAKKVFTTGIDEIFKPRPELIHVHNYEQWPPSAEPVPTFAKICMQRGGGNETYVSRSFVDTWLGIIPIEYELEGEKIRVIGQVLRVTPAVGFDLLRYIDMYCVQQRKSKGKAEWCDLWTQVLNHELDQNLACKSLNALPNPTTVRSYSGNFSPAHILSPYLTLEKILNNLPGPNCGRQVKGKGYTPSTLKISGFPKLTNPDTVNEIIQTARRRDEAYRAGLSCWNTDYTQLMAGMADVVLPEIIPPGIGNDFVWPALNFQIRMNNSHEPMEKFEGMQKVRFPAVAIAILGFLLSADSEDTLGSLEQFVMPHVKNMMEIATFTLMAEKYGGIKNMTADLPRAGMYCPTRRTFELSLNTLNASGIDRLVEAYVRYISSNLTFLARGERGNLFCSFRVQNTAEIIDMLKKRDMPQKIGEGLEYAASRMPEAMRDLEQKLLCDEEMQTLYEIMASMCLLNESARLNALNLSALFALVISDMVSFLGAHQTTWIYKQFTVIVVGGNGHLRYEGNPWSAKRNSSGEGAKYKIWVFLLTGMAFLCDGITGEMIQSLSIRKITRITVPQLEGMCAVTKADNQIVSVPNANILLTPIIFDELLRNLNVDALNALINLLPRDAQQEAITMKTMEPEKNQVKRADGEVDRLQGMGPLVYCMSTNSNPQNSNVGEPIKSLLCAIHAVPPGAAMPDHDVLGGALHSDRKRKLNDQTGDTSEGVSTEPIIKDIREHVIWTLSVLPAVCRRLALLNKVGLTNTEIPRPCIMLFNWFLSFFLNNMNFVIGSTVFSDFHRLMQGYLSRGVGLSMLVTTAKHFRRQGTTYREASLQTTIDMESSAMSLQILHTSLLSGLTRMLDCNMLWTSQIITRILKTPVLDLDWLCSALNDSFPIDNTSPDYAKLRRYLLNMQGAMQANYVAVPQLATKVMYQMMQTYLEKYCSLVKDNFKTYLDMVSETASKKVDLECLLGCNDTSLQKLCQRMGLSHERDQCPDHENNDGSSFLWLQMESRATGGVVIKECFVNVVHHLWMVSVQGPGYLHSENSAVFAERIYSWICRRHLPPQCVPGGMVLMDSFRSGASGATVRPHVCVVNRSAIFSGDHILQDDAQSYYILRGKRDDAAWEKGQDLSEASGFYHPYMIEDSVHMGALDQQWLLVKNTGIPEQFGVLPGLTARAPELKPTRVYPIRRKDDVSGTICIAPKGQSFVLINFPGQATAIAYESWQRTIEDSGIAVGPLVHRPNAVVRLSDNVLGVVSPRTDDPFASVSPFSSSVGAWDPSYRTVRMVHNSTYFLDAAGYYKVYSDSQGLVDVHFNELDLISVGTHIFVEIDIVRDTIQGDRIPFPTHYTHAEGWIRYPDECNQAPSDPECIYVAMRATDGVEIHGFPPEACILIPPRVREHILQRLPAKV